MSMHNTINEETEKVYRIAVYEPNPDRNSCRWLAWHYYWSYSGRRYASLAGLKTAISPARKEEHHQIQTDPNYRPINCAIEVSEITWSPWVKN